ncbi:MAG TPA: hypothetical protein VGM37_10770 [Armatimonadota bacterium]
MNIQHSERLKLRVEALASRLREVSAEISATYGAVAQARERLHAVVAETLMEGAAPPAEIDALRREIARHEAALPALEEQEANLKRYHFEARRDHLIQLRRERPNRWIVLE